MLGKYGSHLELGKVIQKGIFPNFVAINCVNFLIALISYFLGHKDVWFSL